MPDPSASSGQARPTGTVTFLFTDIEGSTRLAQQHPAAWPSAQARHHAILQKAIESHGGYVFQVIGDAFCAAFHTAPDALAAALDAQRALQAESGGDLVVRVRMGLHSGAATFRPDGDYDGFLTLARVQRIMAAGHGGQVLLSQTSTDLARSQLPDAVTMRDLGVHSFKGLDAPEHLFQADALGLRHDFPSPNTLDGARVTPNNLPVQVTSFIGRAGEIVTVKELLMQTRLVTLTGVGGTGKTRLALQTAGEMLAGYPDGVWFVDLAPLADPALIVSAAAAVLGLRETGNLPLSELLAAHLRDRQALIVLDNCEHLIDGCARLADLLLHQCPRVSLLATSREALGIAGEQAFRVPSLPVPPATIVPKGMANLSGLLAQYDAVRLFVERARLAQPSFALTAANASAVVQICVRLDGIPLALELAAARIKALSAEQIASRLTDRFRLLTGGSRTALRRQQTLHATIDWSHNLLSDSERVLLRRLAVFAGGWTLEAAESVCSSPMPISDDRRSEAHGQVNLTTGDVLDLLARLVDKSLVITEERDRATRYRLPETIREYALEKLASSSEGEDLRRRHAACFADLSQNTFGVMFYERETTWQLQLEREVDNIRAAIDWARDAGEALIELRLAGNLYPFWFYSGRAAEGAQRAGDAVARATSVADLPEIQLARARALMGAGYNLWWAQSRAAEARPFLEQALAIALKLGDVELERTAGEFLGDLHSSQSDHAQALAHVERSLAIARASQSMTLVADSLLFTGNAHLRAGHMNVARDCYEEALEVCNAAGLMNHGAYLARRLSYLALHRGEHAAAIKLGRQSLKFNQELDERQGIAACLVAFGAIAGAMNQLERAARLFGAADAMLTAMHVPPLSLDHAEQERAVADAHARMGDAAFEEAFGAGRALSMDAAIAYALEGGDA